MTQDEDGDADRSSHGPEIFDMSQYDSESNDIEDHSEDDDSGWYSDSVHSHITYAPPPTPTAHVSEQLDLHPNDRRPTFIVQQSWEITITVQILMMAIVICQLLKTIAWMN